jgi:hypothetical protein
MWPLAAAVLVLVWMFAFQMKDGWAYRAGVPEPGTQRRALVRVFGGTVLAALLFRGPVPWVWLVAAWLALTGAVRFSTMASGRRVTVETIRRWANSTEFDWKRYR